MNGTGLPDWSQGLLKEVLGAGWKPREGSGKDMRLSARLMQPGRGAVGPVKAHTPTRREERRRELDVGRVAVERGKGVASWGRRWRPWVEPDAVGNTPEIGDGEKSECVRAGCVLFLSCG